MKIAIRKSDGVVLMIADCLGYPTGPDAKPLDPSTYILYDAPEWDWSLAELGDVDMAKPDWASKVMWDGNTLVKRQ